MKTALGAADNPSSVIHEADHDEVKTGSTEVYS
jgi:hypothetical protein